MSSGNIIMELKGYFLLKVFIRATCCLLFILQSYQEVVKYFMGMTNLASYVEHNDNLPFPTTVICLRDPFKMEKFAINVEEYRNWTYSLDEIIDTDRSIPNKSQGLVAEEIATNYEGNCFVLKPPENWTYPEMVFIGLKSNKSLNIYFVDKGEELCILYGSQCGKNVRNGRFVVQDLTNMGMIIARLKVDMRVYLER